MRRLLGRGAAAERLVLAAAPQAILTVDVAEQLAYANAAAVGLLADTLRLGSEETPIRHSLHGVFDTLAADGGHVCALCAALAEPGASSGEATVVDATAGARLRFACAPIVQRGERVGMVVTLERQPTEAEVVRRQQERASRETQALLADLTHELNNPLTVILASAALLRESAEGESNRRRVELIAEAAERCVGIVRTFRSSLRTPRPEDADPAPPPAVIPEPPPAKPSARILVIDDDALVASAMAAALAAEGHAVDIAGDGLAALARVATCVYDVILTDVRMPRLDGPGFYHELGRLRPELLPRVVFVTGDVLSPTTRRFLETVGAPSVRKPFEPRQLRAAVRRLLNLEGLERAPQTPQRSPGPS